MLCLEDIKIDFKCQGFKAIQFGVGPSGEDTVLMMESTSITEEQHCPRCGGRVYIYDRFNMNLKDMPWHVNTTMTLCCSGYRYRCTECGETFTEEIPFKYPGTRITWRAANFIKAFLKEKISIKAIQNITKIHWETIRRVQKEIMDEAISEHEKEQQDSGYKPRILAIDEFAIHKGHSYATCVMDVETGVVLWVGKGRSINDFSKFFEDISIDSLSAVIAVAMDMNASYNQLVAKFLPNAQIVYDRFHMQAQYGREVLGVVRLDEARKHQANSKEILAGIDENTDKDTVRAIKQEAKSETKLYSSLKRARWALLTNGDKLLLQQSESLRSILELHHDLAVCYAMKEEMCRLFELSDYQQACDGWSNWFDAAKSSGIPALVKFATLKEKRLSGLAAHALFPISTGRLEGFNNKIKVAKRIAYGYRDESYFFTLIRFLSLPSVRSSSPNFP